MKILGISYGYHDSSASLTSSDGLLISSLEERFTRQKHDSNFPTNAVEYCLNSAECTIDDIDAIFFHEDPQLKFSRVLTSSFFSYPFSRLEFVASSMSWFGKKLWTFNDISKRLGVRHSKIHYLNHHYSHAVQAFIGSGFSTSNILIVDAVGEWCSSSLYTGRLKNNEIEIKLLKKFDFPNSLGLAYSAITSYLGFTPNSDECSTMALASFGKPRFINEFREIIKVNDEGYLIDQSYFNFLTFSRPSISRKFIKMFGAPSKRSDIYTSDSLEKTFSTDSNENRLVDIAASAQRAFEEALVGLCTLFPDQKDHLCLAGGGALNCVANQKIVENASFKKIYIPPDPGDGGTSLGVASLGLSKFSGTKPLEIKSAYMGRTFKNNEAARTLPVSINALNRFKGKNFFVSALDSPNQQALAVSKCLLRGLTVGLFQGKSECGPRALGNRSILFRPDDIELAKNVSTKIKKRAFFRPYALAMTPHCAKDVLKISEDQYDMYRWMQFSASVTERYQKKLTSGVHIDGTTRPQICQEADNPLLFSILENFGTQFGHSVLVNTSFNEAGYPMVDTPLDAFVMYLRTDLNCLMIEDLWFVEERFLSENN